MFFSLISDFSEIFEVDIAVLILGCGTGICVTMLMIQMEIVSVLSTCLNCNLIISICFSKSHDAINQMILWKAVFYGFWVCALLLLVGEVGQKLSEKFTEINGVMDQLNWYAYPREVKRMLPTILTNLQQPVIIKCFVFIFCDREYSKRVSLFHHQNQLFCSINSLKYSDRSSTPFTNSSWFYAKWKIECHSPFLHSLVGDELKTGRIVRKPRLY